MASIIKAEIFQNKLWNIMMPYGFFIQNKSPPDFNLHPENSISRVS